MRGRIEELDALRGLMLVWITFTHLPTALSAYINQPLGFFAATEGFIFVSALFTGRIYYQIAERDGLSAMCRKLWLRTARLYCYQLLLLAFAFVIEAPIAAHGNRPAVHNLLDYYFSVGRTHAFLDAALLIYRPPLLDILPIYIIFLAFTPAALILGARLGWKYVLGGGFTLWLLAQFGLRDFVHQFMVRDLGLRIPLNQMGAFNLWAWYLWWLIGLWVGVRWAKNDLDLVAWAKRLTVPAAVVAVAFLSLRYAQAFGPFPLGKFAVLLDKWNFGIGRMIDFVAVAAVAIRFRSVLAPLAIRPLVMMGQASLPVFCVHLLCVFAALTIMGEKAIVGGWQSVAVVLISVSALMLTAKVAAVRRARAKDGRTGPQTKSIPPRIGYGKDLDTRVA